MPYESLRNELERRLGRKAEFRNQEETLDFRSENWSGDEEGQLAKALAKARERAKQVRKPLKIERLPHRNQRSLKDFSAEKTDWINAHEEYAPTELIIKRLKESGVWELGDDPYAGAWDAIKWWATVKIKDGTLVRATEDELGDLTAINIILIDGQYAKGYGRVTVSYTDVDNADWEDSYNDEMEKLGKELTIIFENNGMFQSGDDLEYGDMGEFYNVVWGDLIRHDCATNAELDIYEDDFIVMECNSCGRTATFRQETPYEGPRNPETFNAESKDEAIVVDGYRPKRVEAWTSAGNTGNIKAVIFYVGDLAERRYTMLDATTPRTERELLGFTRPQITGGSSIINPTGITRADVDELMQYSTGEPWNGKYVLYTDEGNFLFYEPKTFQAEPAMAVKCFECERPGYSDEMSRFALGYLCARCSRPEIDWSRYDAESLASDNISLKRTEQKILKYLSDFNPERIENKYEAPEALTLPSIANAVGVVRSGVHNPLKKLQKKGLVAEVRRRPPGRRRQVKVYFPTHEGRELGRRLSRAYSSESLSLDIDGDGIIEPWELAQQGMLTRSMQEFNAPRSKSYYKPSELRERAIEVMKTHDGWMGKEELVAKINADLPARRKTTSFNVSRALGAGRGGVEPFYVTTDGRIYYYGDQDRGEFIKGVI